MTPAEAKALVKELVPTCKELGVQVLQVGEIRIELAPANSGPVDPAMVKAFADVLNKGMPTDEDVLFYSAPGGPMPRPEEPPVEAPKTARGRRA